MKDDQSTTDELARRKRDHIDLALDSRTLECEQDRRFMYEPLLSAHPNEVDLSKTFLGKTLDFPLWISSMTGGTTHARKINENLAKLCAEFKLGMGLGSCRSLLHSHKTFDDFNMRPVLGESQPLYANLGIAQIEELIENKSTEKIEELIFDLQADGLIIHINPLQEWAQPEGDKINRPPIETIQELVELHTTHFIVKEVGQGMGPESLSALFKLPIQAVEFGAFGGTNFTRLELNRTDDSASYIDSFSTIGHVAEEMVEFVNTLSKARDRTYPEIIISGGVRDYLHGFYLIESCAINAVYGQASAFLKPAMESYQSLKRHFIHQMEGFKMAKAYLRVRK